MGILKLFKNNKIYLNKTLTKKLKYCNIQVIKTDYSYLFIYLPTFEAGAFRLLPQIFIIRE